MRRTEVLQGIRLMKFEEILDRTRSRELSQEEAASVLGMSERTFRRWRERYDAEGAEGLARLRHSALTPGSTARMLRGDQAEIRHELARVGKPGDVTEFRDHRRSTYQGHSAK